MKNTITFIICLLFGLMFINSGLNKFLNYIPVPEDLPEKVKILGEAMMQIGWLYPLVATVEIIGGILFIIPRFRALGAITIFPVLIGILLTHIIGAPSGLPVAIVLMIINLWVIYSNRRKYLPMISAEKK